MNSGGPEAALVLLAIGPLRPVFLFEGLGELDPVGRKLEPRLFFRRASCAFGIQAADFRFLAAFFGAGFCHKMLTSASSGQAS